MNKNIWNVSILVGVSMVGIGLSLISIPIGLSVTGALIIGLTIYVATLSARG